MKLRPGCVPLLLGGVNVETFVLWRPSLNSRQPRHYSRQTRRPRKLLPHERERLAKRELLRSNLLRQYEEERRPLLVRNAIRFEQSPLEQSYNNVSPEHDQESPREPRQSLDDNVHCGIFWDIENVKHDSDPPAVVIEAIRDFAGTRITPIFQAYTSHFPIPVEARLHAIYAQLGVTFIQCYDQGKDTADKKIISDMWKFYASYQHYSRQQRIRIILITGDRDFADAIGQLRNLGVEVGILTGSRTTTAPVFDDYTIGMRVLPLLGVVKARARYIELDAYQTTKRLPTGDFKQATGSTKDYAVEDVFEASSIDDVATTKSNVSKRVNQTNWMKYQSAVDQKSTTSTKDSSPFLSEKLSQTVEIETSVADSKAPEIKTNEKKIPDAKSTSASNLSSATTVSPVMSILSSNMSSNITTISSFPPLNAEAIVDTQSTDSQSTKQLSNRSSEWLQARARERVRREMTNSWQEMQGKREMKEKESNGGVISRLQNFFGLSFTDSRAFASPRLIQENSSSDVLTTPSVDQMSESTRTADSGAPLSNTTVPDESSSEQPYPDTTLRSAVDAVISPPSSSRHLTPEIPINQSLFAAGRLTLPSLEKVANNQVRKGQQLSKHIFTKIPGLPNSSPRTETSLIEHYTKEVQRYRPEGISDLEISQILNAWLKIQSSSVEGVSEATLRRVVKMTLSSAFEIVEARKEAKERLNEHEKLLMEIQQAEAKLANEKGRKGMIGEIRRKMGDEKSDDIKLNENEAETGNAAVNLEKKLDQKMDDTQLNQSKSEDTMLEDAKMDDPKVDEIVNEDVRPIHVTVSSEAKEAKEDAYSTPVPTKLSPAELSTSSDPENLLPSTLILGEQTLISQPSPPRESTEEGPLTWAPGPERQEERIRP